MRKLATTFGLLCLGLTSCDTVGTMNVPGNRDLKAGGVYVAYNMGCEKGCDQIEKGDLIQKYDGKTVKAAAELEGIADGQPHKLELLAKQSKEAKQVEVVAKPKDNMPPLQDVPPFWLVGAEALNQAPDWARRRMFGHASPSVMLVSINGGILDGRQLYGKKRLMVYWDWGDRVEEGAAVDYMQVLQKAQTDLAARGVEVMFVHVTFPANRGTGRGDDVLEGSSVGRKAAMNDTDLRGWTEKHGVESGGQKLPALPVFRFPNKTEFNAARELGMENAFTVFENLGQSPAIVMLDEGGIVRWHSEGIQEPPQGADVTDPEQYTVIEAVKFALEKL